MDRLRAWGLAALLTAGAGSGAWAQVGHDHGGMKAGSRIAGPTLCAACAKSFEKAVKSQPCASCQEGQVPVQGGQAGYAYVGSGMPGDVPAVVGEPTPIGVVRAGYSAGMPAGPSNWSPSMTGGDATGRAFVGGGAVPPAPSVIAPPPPKRPSVLSHLFGFSRMRNDLNEVGKNWGRRDRNHAAMTTEAMTNPLAASRNVNALPANWVYGR